MAIRGTRTSTINILENVMHISIVGGTTVIWAGSVTDFYGQDKIGMGTFAPGADLDYDFTVLMSSGAGDEYQNKETVFDLTLGFWGNQHQHLPQRLHLYPLQRQRQEQFWEPVFWRRFAMIPSR